MKKHLKIILICTAVVTLAILGILYFTTHKKLVYKENTSTQLYEPEYTHLHFPVFIAVSDLEQLVNRRLKTILVDKTQAVKNQKDSLVIKVIRTGNIKFNIRQQQLYSSVPLKIQLTFIKKMIGNSSIQVFKKDPLSFEITAKMLSSFTLTNDLKIDLDTRLEEIIWKEEPTAKIAGINFNLKKMVDRLLHEKAPDITDSLDMTIQRKVNLRKPINKIWNNLQKSMKTNKHEKDIYIKVQPKSLAVHLDKTQNDSLRLNLHIQSKLYLRVGKDTSMIKKIPLPSKIRLMNNFDEEENSNLHLHALIPLYRLNEVLNRRIANNKLDVSGLSLNIKNIEVINSTKTIISKITIEGDLSGTVLLKGLPYLSKDKKVLFIKNIGVESRFNKPILNSLTDLLHEQILSLLAENTTFNLNETMSSIPELVRNGLKKTKIVKKADITLNDLQIEGLQIELTKHNIQLLVNGTSDFEIAVRKEALRKPVKKK